ncbi:hypothetical protein GCM10020295_75620 [Streptomyces cinereospinus]
MDEDRGAAAVEFGEQRFEAGVAEVDAVGVGLDRDAVAAEHVHGVGQFVEGGVDVGQGKGGEVAEPVGMVPLEAGARLVDVAGEGARRPVVAEVGAG